ncbi:MAG: HU family DNA-binding protein [Pseudomonadota bacterium]
MPTKAAPKKTTTTRRKTTTTRTRAKTTPNAAPSAAPKAAPKTAAPKAVAAPNTPPVSVVKDVPSTAGKAELKKRELMDLVVERTDVKKKFAKPVIEAMIEVMGEALAEERPLNLQPMGRVLPQRVKDAGKHRVIITRIRQSKDRAGQTDAAPGEMVDVAKAVK